MTRMFSETSEEPGSSSSYEVEEESGRRSKTRHSAAPRRSPDREKEVDRRRSGSVGQFLGWPVEGVGSRSGSDLAVRQARAQRCPRCRNVMGDAKFRRLTDSRRSKVIGFRDGGGQAADYLENQQG